jgi:hypothetical protein
MIALLKIVAQTYLERLAASTVCAKSCFAAANAL